MTAIQLKLDTDGFTYRKWGAEQRCKSGDWLVDSGSDLYTIDDAVFRGTYRDLGEGRYRKVTPVWAEQVDAPGSVRTKEGRSHYQAGDYVVYNDEQRSDGYCMSAEKFRAIYEPDDEGEA